MMMLLRYADARRYARTSDMLCDSAFDVAAAAMLTLFIDDGAMFLPFAYFDDY